MTFLQILVPRLIHETDNLPAFRLHQPETTSEKADYATAFMRSTDGKIWGKFTLDHLALEGIATDTFLRLMSIFIDLGWMFYQKSKDARDAAAAALQSEEGSNSDDGTPTTH